MYLHTHIALCHTHGRVARQTHKIDTKSRTISIHIYTYICVYTFITHIIYIYISIYTYIFPYTRQPVSHPWQGIPTHTPNRYNISRHFHQEYCAPNESRKPIALRHWDTQPHFGPPPAHGQFFAVRPFAINFLRDPPKNGVIALRSATNR